MLIERNRATVSPPEPIDTELAKNRVSQVTCLVDKDIPAGFGSGSVEPDVQCPLTREGIGVQVGLACGG